MVTALVIFCGTYLFLAGAELPFLKLDRPGGALLGAVAMVALSVLTPEQAIREAINWDTILLLLGMMILSSAMAEAGVFDWISHAALRRGHSPRALLTLLVIVAAGLSALLVNDTVCLMLTPLVLAMTASARLPPLPYLLGLAFASNAGSVATLTGNPQNMLIGTLSGIQYLRFALALSIPALVATATVLLVLRLVFRRELAPREPLAAALEPPRLDRTAAGICLGLLAAVVAGFALGYSLAWTALTGAAVLLVLLRRSPKRVFARVDGTLLLFFAGLFVVTHGVAHTGVAERLYLGFQPLLGQNGYTQAITFGGFTLVASQLVSNVPFVLLAGHWVPRLADPTLGWLSLALCSTLAGNLTPVASVANLIVLELAGERGRIPFLRFLGIGAACTFLPLLLALAVLLIERALGLFA